MKKDFNNYKETGMKLKECLKTLFVKNNLKASNLVWLPSVATVREIYTAIPLL